MNGRVNEQFLMGCNKDIDDLSYITQNEITQHNEFVDCVTNEYEVIY